MVLSLSTPTGDGREAWLERLRRARQRVGAAHFLHAPLILGDERCFPDRFTPDMRGATRLVRRMQLHACRAGDDEIPLFAVFDTLLESVSTPGGNGSRTTGHGSTALFEHDDDGNLILVLEQSMLELPDALLEAVAMAVTRWFLERDDDSDDRNGELDDDDVIATAVALGFGWLLLQGAWVVEQGGHMEGRDAVSWQRRMASSRATPGELALLYACWARARGVTTTKQIGEGLRANQRAALDAAMKAPPSADFNGPPSPPWPLLLTPIDVSDIVDSDDSDDSGVDAHDVAAVDDDAPPVFRVGDRRSAGPIALGLSVWPLLALVGGALFQLDITLPLAFYVVVGSGTVVAGTIIGLRNIVDICSDPTCKTELPAFASACPGCRRPLGGRIRNADERLAAEEDWRRERLAPTPTTSAAMPR